MKTATEPELVSNILSYFIRHPQAADSLEGIARWRLLDEAVHRCVRGTHQALVWLVARGVLQQVGGPGLEPIFSLVPSKRKEAERLVAALQQTGDDDGRDDDDQAGRGRIA